MSHDKPTTPNPIGPLPPLPVPPPRRVIAVGHWRTVNGQRVREVRMVASAPRRGER